MQYNLMVILLIVRGGNLTKDELKIKLNEFLESERLNEKSKNTIVDYRNAINKFINYIPDDQEINKNLIIGFKEYLVEEKFAIKSRNKYIIVVNKFLKFIGYGDCTVKKFKEQQKSSLDDGLEPQEHKRMLRWAKKLEMMDMYYIIKIFAHSGPRVDELKYYTVESLDSNYIKGAYNKGKERTLIMTNELRRELKQYCKEQKIKSGYIFISPKNKDKMLHNSTIWRRLKKIAKCAKINPNKIHAHAWRHLFAKKCKENGIDLDELRDILGHSNINTTAIYTMTSNKEKRNKMERIKY